MRTRTPQHSDDGVTGSTLQGGKSTQAQSQRTPVVDGDCVCGAWYGALGLEPTPDLFVAHMVEVFREVWRVLRKDGTLWLNLGDSYAGSWGAQSREHAGKHAPNVSALSANQVKAAQRKASGTGSIPPGSGLKPKDLVGIPWMVAKALQAPYYTGRIRDERDRIWLAAMIDGEGCMFIHRRKAGQSNGQGYERKNDSFGAGLEVANTSEAIIQRVSSIAGLGSIFRHEKDRRQPLYRWNLRSNQCRNLIREVYPYLVGKQHQARLLLGCLSSGPEAAAAHAALIDLHNGRDVTVDFPAPASMYEPGFYLRSDIVWSKANPMPESVTDRPTKAHEYVFLMSKSDRYFYDADAVREEAIHEGRVVKASGNAAKNAQKGTYGQTAAGFTQHDTLVAGRNMRTVWQIATQPYPGAHFATFPEALPERCIKAGSAAQACGVCGAPWERVTDVERVGPSIANPTKINELATNGIVKGGTTNRRLGPDVRDARATLGFRPTCDHDDGSSSSVVLDPFNGSGTTGRVALSLGRRYVGLDMSREYLTEQAIARIDPITHTHRTTDQMALPL